MSLSSFPDGSGERHDLRIAGREALTESCMLMRGYPSPTIQGHRLWRRSFLAGLTAAAGTATAAVAQQGGLKFATGSEGGGFVVYASAFVDAVKWANPKIGVRPLPTRGSLENVPLLETGTVDIGLVSGEMVQEVFNPKDKPPTNSR